MYFKGIVQLRTKILSFAHPCRFRPIRLSFIFKAQIKIINESREISVPSFKYATKMLML